MEKQYLIYVEGKLAGRKGTNPGAKAMVKELELKGYKNVSYAYELEAKS